MPTLKQISDNSKLIGIPGRVYRLNSLSPFWYYLYAHIFSMIRYIKEVNDPFELDRLLLKVKMFLQEYEKLVILRFGNPDDFDCRLMDKVNINL